LYKNTTIIDNQFEMPKGIPMRKHQSRIPSWNNLGRPKKVKAGTFGFNFQTTTLEYWNGIKWLILPMKKI
jgi:hypothetical protein